MPDMKRWRVETVEYDEETYDPYVNVWFVNAENANDAQDAIQLAFIHRQISGGPRGIPPTVSGKATADKAPYRCIPRPKVEPELEEVLPHEPV